MCLGREETLKLVGGFGNHSFVYSVNAADVLQLRNAFHVNSQWHTTKHSFSMAAGWVSLVTLCERL